jgi:hypothetical protein
VQKLEKAENVCYEHSSLLCEWLKKQKSLFHVLTLMALAGLIVDT